VRDENPVAGIVRVDDDRRQRLDVAQIDAGRVGEIVHEAVERRSAWDKRYVMPTLDDSG
jgi:hypothetical protein